MSHETGFTLVELLVVIAIIAVLAVLSIVGIDRMKVAGAKSRSISQMKNISVGIALWMGENSALEPFYISDGTGDYPNECARYSVSRPGNPAMALYRKGEPGAGYVQDFNTFFSPLVKPKFAAPTLATYDPAKASTATPWGTYTYLFPYATDARLTSKQRAAGVVGFQVASEAANGKLMLAEFYDDSYCPPKYGKRIYHALLADGSVRYVADNDVAWGKWKKGS